VVKNEQTFILNSNRRAQSLLASTGRAARIEKKEGRWITKMSTLCPSELAKCHCIFIKIVQKFRKFPPVM